MTHSRIIFIFRSQPTMSVSRIRMKHRCESWFRAIWRNFPRSIEIHRNSMDRYIGGKKEKKKKEKTRKKNRLNVLVRFLRIS